MAQAAYDVDPDLGKSAHYMRNNMSVAGYKYLLAVGELTESLEAKALGMPLLWYTSSLRNAVTIITQPSPLQSSHTLREESSPSVERINCLGSPFRDLMCQLQIVVARLKQIIKVAVTCCRFC